ncbi:2OG-Fe(II) oxygenase [Paenibacillus hamazuiensis]|uniref:2OG-Fe(II) oxygenase n=1 Tax=Paenibacillus hamazuiensis TaxID=2936508 RepID=UPI00200D320F|nr:2OG-Fe(II) oxygenase [Paenibacillus hamazuiensis]
MNSIAERIAAMDWQALHRSLSERGFAKLPALLQAEECRELIAMYDEAPLFRTRIDMRRYRFGEGEYQYFADPLPFLVQQLRMHLYPELAAAANAWLRLLGKEEMYPPELESFLAECARYEQTRATPLLLKYEQGGYNCLHQDLYGDIYFPFQVVFALNRREVDYTGGEFLLVEQRPRAQSRGHAIALEQGEGVIFPTQHRPVAGTRGYYRATLRHGVSEITGGRRFSLGVIFHNAR